MTPNSITSQTSFFPQPFPYSATLTPLQPDYWYPTIHFQALADAYTWKDQQGRVRCTERPQLSFTAGNLSPPVPFGYLSEQQHQPSDQDQSETIKVIEMSQESTRMESPDALTFNPVQTAAMEPDSAIC
jgi:hypothetical protein